MKLLESIIKTMQESWGIDISCFGEAFAQSTIEKRMTSLSVPELESYCHCLAHNQPERDALLKALSVHYSLFFRNPLTFALLEEMILPELVEEKINMERAELRIWSAGCAAGQEAWSLAILLAELVAARKAPIAIRIFATDNSEANLAIAREGLYDKRYLQNVQLKDLEKYFEQHGDKYRVVQRLRNWVEFSCFQLLDPKSFCPPESIFGDFDLIFCSNVLFYYRPFYQRIILDKMWHALGPHGYFVTGEAEIGIVNEMSGFSGVTHATAAFNKVKRRV